MSKDAIDVSRAVIAAGGGNNPSPQALQAHITSLEQELRNADFRLQFAYYERASIVKSLHAAKSLADKTRG